MTLKENNPIAFAQIYTFPDETYTFNMETVSSDSSELMNWQCNEDSTHIWASHIYLRGNINDDMGCPFCLNEKLRVKGPKLIRSYIGSNTKYNFVKNSWHCLECKSVWEDNNVEIPQYQSICINCAAKIKLRYLSEISPELEKEWDSSNIFSFFDVNEEYGLPVNWKCNECHQIWNSTISEKTYGIKKCPYCLKKLPIPDKTSLYAMYPKLNDEWNWKKNKRKPQEEFPDSINPAFWTCLKCNMLYTARIVDRVKNNKDGKCPNCSSEHPISREEYDYILSELDEINQLDKDCISPSLKVTLWWNCNECSNKWSGSLYDRLYNNKKCYYCDGNYVIPGKTSFKVLHSDLMPEWCAWTNSLLINADDILPSSTKNVWWFCLKCNHTYQMSPSRKILFQRRNQESCGYCKGYRRKKLHFL